MLADTLRQHNIFFMADMIDEGLESYQRIKSVLYDVSISFLTQQDMELSETLKADVALLHEDIQRLIDVLLIEQANQIPKKPMSDN